MIVQLLIDNGDFTWSRFAQKLMELSRKVQTEAMFVYIKTSEALRDETERLCRNLGLEDYTYILHANEEAPEGTSRCPRTE